MNPKNKQSTEKVCPTCGTHLSLNATRCLVCGRTFTDAPAPTLTNKIKTRGLPQFTVSLPIALGAILILIAIGAGIIYFVLRGSGQIIATQPTATQSPTPTYELSPTPTLSPTPAPTSTTEPPVEYTIKEGDTCSSIALAFNVTVKSIADLNNLSSDCGVLTLNQKLLIPRPTPTASPQPTNTLSIAQATEAACQKITYTVGENDTLSGIAANYNVSVETLKTYNGKTSDNVYLNEVLTIPLCERLPTSGPTPTATLPAPFAATNLLLPADGAVFTATNDTVTLQWAAIGGLLEGDSYAVTIEDLTAGEGKKLVDYTKDTKYIVPVSFRPAETTPHIIRWYIQPVRQSGTTQNGDAIYVTAGYPSNPRVFIWSGIGTTTN
ncbi:MAG: LysM peptidoglycan-binding domain-containing protein [Anaerolineaceae bacterium]|jgi:LysM repeat protein|nr:MAG: LysM peptidoglycan-binding domain-containing protein [Anaerolineaceae bacterium]